MKRFFYQAFNVLKKSTLNKIWYRQNLKNVFHISQLYTFSCSKF